MTSTKEITQGKLKPTAKELDNNIAKKNLAVDDICKTETGNRTLYQSNIRDSILTGSQYVPIKTEFPYVRKRFSESSRASTSSSVDDKQSQNLFILVIDDEAEEAEELESKSWDPIRKREITESIVIHSLVQKYCEPKSRTAWCKFKLGFSTKFRSKVHPKIVNGIRETEGSFLEHHRTLPAAEARVKDEEEDCTDAEESIDEIEELYASLVYLTQHQVGFDVSNECSQESLLNHLQSAFKVDNETHQQVLDVAQNMEAPEMHLNVEVIEAKELVSKDANGKSDPFCALYLESTPTRRYNTAVKQATLSPVWEEHFELPLDNPENDVLSLEVWDFDTAQTVPEKMSKVKDVKGVRGLVKRAKEIAFTATTGNHDDEFIGKCQIAVKDISVMDHTKWYSLEKNKLKCRGNVRLKLAFSAEYNAQVALQEHRHLLRILLLHEIETEKVEEYYWCGRWSAPAEAILLQHSAQRGLLTRNMALAQWLEYIRVHQEHPLSFTLLNDLAVKLLRSMNNSLFSDDEIRIFWDAAKKLLYFCLNSVRKIRSLAIGERGTITQLKAILGILSSLDSFKKQNGLDLFPANMYGWHPKSEGPKTDIMQALEEAVIQGSEEWYDHVLKNHTSQGDTDEDVLEYYTIVIQLITYDLQRAIEFYDKVFIDQTNLPYARTLYIRYGERICDMCMIKIKDVCARLKRSEVANSDEIDEELASGRTRFQLYSTLRKYATLGYDLDLDGLEHMEIQNYHEWFRDGVAHWLDIEASEASRRIGRAVKLDKLQPVSSNAQHSSSAVDTLTIFYQIKRSWTELAWPDVEDSHTLIAKLIANICKCSVEYADKMAREVEVATQRMYDMENKNRVYGNKFEVSNAWCFVINNIDYIQTSIGPLVKDLGLENIVKSLAAIKPQREAEKCRKALQLVIDDAMEIVSNKVVELLELVARKMAPAMSSYLTEIAELFDAPRNAKGKLLPYLKSNITTLRDNLSKTNYERVHLVIQEIMSKTVYDLVNNNFKKRRPLSFYANLHRTVSDLIRFFNLGGDKTSNNFEKIEQLLELHGLETAELIHRYNQEKLQEQKVKEETIDGQLTVKAHFVDNLLKIQIMNARNLRPLDSNGHCNPHVEIRLLPEEKFVRVRQLKTQIHKEVLFPLFDENFSISLTSELREIQNAMVSFEVNDKDFFRTRFMAEAFLSFREIPETGPDRDFDSLEQIHLKLSRPTGKNSCAVRALERRRGDGRAVDFMSKLNTKINTR